jgi:hypothetical protein
MPNANVELLKPIQERDLVDQVMEDADIARFIAQNVSVIHRTREAAEWLVMENPNTPLEGIVQALQRLLQPLLTGKLTVFFSYKGKDMSIATQIADWLEEWSAGKLEIQHMARFGVDEVGRNWRKKIEETIPRCDWFLLLLPNPGEEGNERDWVLYEAGYFMRGQSLSGRFVCLHHPENEVADALGEKQTVPAKTAAVENFLKGLFQESNWVPGMPPINSELKGLKSKAEQIVNLIQRKASPSVKFCCGPHMAVAFDDASAVRGWNELAGGRVIDSNEDCKGLFGLEVGRPLFGDWLANLVEAEEDAGWVKELAEAVQATGKGLKVPFMRGSFLVDGGRRIRPMICAVKRRRSDQRAEAIDILFSEVETARDTSHMSPGLAALAINLWFSVRFRYQVLEHYVGRELKNKDVLAFNRALMDLQHEAAIDPRFKGDWSLIRNQTLESFVGEDKAAVKKMYERWDELYRPDGEGEMDKAVADLDTLALAHLVEELIKMNQSFLAVTSKRFAELVSSG